VAPVVLVNGIGIPVYKYAKRYKESQPNCFIK